MMKIYLDCNVFTVAASGFVRMDEFYDSEGIFEEKNRTGTRFNVINFRVLELDAIPEAAGRLCYMSYDNPRPGGNAEYLKNILKVDHGSVLEHANVSFILTGVSRSLTHELVRHRAGMAYSQLSQRYVDESDVDIVVPPDRLVDFRKAYNNFCFYLNNREKQKLVIANSAYNNPIKFTGTNAEELLTQYLFDIPTNSEDYHQLQWLLGIIQTFTAYQKDVERYKLKWKEEAQGTELRKRIRQMSRAILPNCTETKIFVTGNMRAWRHILLMRGSRHADPEIRRLALKIFHELKIRAGNTMQDLEIVSVDGIGNTIEKVKV